MKVLLISLLTCLSATISAGGASAQGAAAAGQTQGGRPPELDEAARLSRTVVQLYSAGKSSEALPLAERALAIREKLLGPSAVAVGDALMNMAAVLAATNKADRARAAYERAASIYEAGLGPDHAKTTDALNALGWFHYHKKDYRKAESAFSRAAESRERAHGAVHELVADSLSGLAAVYLANGEEAKRDETYGRLVDVAEKLPEVPKRLERILLSYRCTGAQRDGAGQRQLEVLKRIDELAKTRARLHPAEAAKYVPEGEVLNGRAVSKPAPTYPDEAKRAGAQGAVVVHITVDGTGRVVDAAAICGHPLLYEASVRAARQARFTPTLHNGQPVKVTGTITYNFNLR